MNRQRVRLLGGIVLADALSGCVSSGQDFDQAKAVSYCAGDLVVVGRIQEETLTPIPNDNDILGRGRVDMLIQIKRTLAGSAPAASVRATTIAHALARKDLDFVFVLKPAAGAAYELRTGTVLFGNRAMPKVTEDCAATRSV